MPARESSVFDGLKLLAWLVLVFSCQSRQDQAQVINYPQPGHSLTTEELAEAYCGACHLFPQPDLLNKSLWQQTVLKNMGRRLGVRSQDYDPYYQVSMFDAYTLRTSGVYPQDTLITDEDWQRIVDYYLQEAPQEIIPPVSKPPTNWELPHFQLHEISDLPALPLVTLVEYDSVSGHIYWGNREGDVMIMDKRGKIQRQLQMNFGVADLLIENDREYFLCMGTLGSSEQPVGTLYDYSRGYQGTTILSELHRPVHLASADLDRDGLRDLVISQFSDQTGRFSWFQAQDSGYVERVIKQVPGTLKTEIRDFNDDGRLDIMALMGQGDEGISIFFQQRSGRFKEQRILRFPPVYGSSSFQLTDFNGDGLQDILYTAGDNADYSNSLKRYHGVRIFLNEGQQQYREAYFYPMYGAMKAQAADFDGDGDQDICAVSFYPDYQSEQPQGFVYLLNHGDLNFAPYSFVESIDGRWSTMDIADYDKDGDQDILLGSLLFKIPQVPDSLKARWTQKNYQLLILENTFER